MELDNDILNLFLKGFILFIFFLGWKKIEEFPVFPVFVLNDCLAQSKTRRLLRRAQPTGAKLELLGAEYEKLTYLHAD